MSTTSASFSKTCMLIICSAKVNLILVDNDVLGLMDCWCIHGRWWRSALFEGTSGSMSF